MARLRDNRRLRRAVTTVATVAALLGPLGLVTPPAHAFSAGRQTETPVIKPGATGQVTMRVSEFFGIFQTSARTMVWTAPTGATITDLPSCSGTSFRKSISVAGQTATCERYIPGSKRFPYLNTAVIKVRPDTPFGPSVGILELQNLNNVYTHNYVVLVSQ